MYDIRGIVKEVGETKTFKNDFKTRDLIITRVKKIKKQNSSDQIVNDFKIQFTQKRTEYLDKVAIGEDVKVSFDMTSNYWDNGTKKVLIQNLSGFGVSSFGMPKHTHIEEKEENVEYKDDNKEDDDDLPF